MRKTNIRAILFIGIIGCGLSVAAGAAPAATPLAIREGWVSMTNVLSPMVFAKTDIMKQYGKSYTVEPVHFTGTSAELTALASGEVDFITIAYSSLGVAIENAHLDDLRVVADGFQDGARGYLSSPYLVRNDSGIKTVEDIKGKVVGVNVIGAAVDLAARAMLREHHLEANRDYTVVEAPFPTIGAMLLQHKADLISDVPPFIYDPKLAAETHVLFTMKDAIGTSQMIVLATRAEFLAKHRAALDDFFADMLRGIHWILAPANRPEAIALAARLSKLPPQRLSVYFLTQKDYYHNPQGLPDLAALQHDIDNQHRLGFLKAAFYVRKYADLSFIERAAKRVK